VVVWLAYENLQCSGNIYNVIKILLKQTFANNREHFSFSTYCGCSQFY